MRNFKQALGHKLQKPLKYPIGAFDIETHGLFGTYLDGFLKYEDDPTYYRCRTMEDLWQRITFRKNVILYAHNFRGYESNYLIDIIPPTQKLQVILQGDTQVIGFILQFEDGEIELRDSLALVPMGLGEAAKAFRTPTQKGDIGLKKGEVYDPSNSIHQEYCMDDVQVTIELVKRIIELQNTVYGCGIGWTSASTAMAAWRSTIPKGKTYHRMSKANELFCREGYYGGFVYPGLDTHVHDDIVSIDRNAAYAAVMRGAYPVGKPEYTVDFVGGLLGMYEVKVHNEGKFPVIPYRSKQGLLWPQGSFTSIVTSEEVSYARSLGIDVDILEGLVWNHVEYPFLEFIDNCERVEFGDPDKKSAIKLNRNGLYGKFGSKLIVYEACMTEENLEGWTPLIDPITGNIQFNLWTREKENDACYIQPAWAAFVTARQRQWLFETIHTVGLEHVRYCDTDSVKADGWRVRECIDQGLIDTENHYGGSKIDEEYVWFQCLGSKVYHGELTEACYQELLKKNPDADRVKARSKGISNKYHSTKLFEDTASGIYEPVRIETANSTFVRMKRGLPMQRTISRKMTNRLNSKAWKFHNDGGISPIIL